MALALHEKQGVALQTPATEVLYGGAAGGGKSHLMRVAAISWCHVIPGLQVYLFRRHLPDLVKNHIEGPKGFRAMLSPWTTSGYVQMIEGEIRFGNGAKIWLCHCNDEKDVFNYHGAEIHVLLIDELTHFTETVYRFLRGRVRAVGLPPTQGPLPVTMPRILCASNPGNIGHHWVKAAFIDGTPPLAIARMSDDEGGMLRQFIPARLDDNPSMATDDPQYRARLRGMGSKALVKAMEEGDWSVVEGAFFDCWSSKRHVLRPFAMPEHWLRFRSFDWGSASPFSVGWWAVASEDFWTPQGVFIPQGAMIRYREWYGAKKSSADGILGLKMRNEDIATGILQRESGDKVSYGVADPSIFRADGGPSIAEQMMRAGVLWRKADNTRVAKQGAISGWAQVRDRLIGNADGHPMLFVFDTCVDLIRTLPAMQHDSDHPEDVRDSNDDHAPDECRYAANSRPWARPKPKPPHDALREFVEKKPTFNDHLAANERRLREHA